MNISKIIGGSYCIPYGVAGIHAKQIACKKQQQSGQKQTKVEPAESPVAVPVQSDSIHQQDAEQSGDIDLDRTHGSNAADCC